LQVEELTPPQLDLPAASNQQASNPPSDHWNGSILHNRPTSGKPDTQRFRNRHSICLLVVSPGSSKQRPRVPTAVGTQVHNGKDTLQALMFRPSRIWIGNHPARRKLA
jgi:hypothetical protein